MNFDEMVELINNLNKSTNEECMICHLPVESNKIKLKCTHTYHTDCIKILKINQSIVCPYCQVTSRIPNENIPISNTVVDNKTCNNMIYLGKNKGIVCKKINCSCNMKKCICHKKIVADPCNVILKTGKNKGTVCNRHKCKIHNKILNV